MIRRTDSTRVAGYLVAKDLTTSFISLHGSAHAAQKLSRETRLRSFDSSSLRCSGDETTTRFQFDRILNQGLDAGLLAFREVSHGRKGREGVADQRSRMALLFNSIDAGGSLRPTRTMSLIQRRAILR